MKKLAKNLALFGRGRLMTNPGFLPGFCFSEQLNTDSGIYMLCVAIPLMGGISVDDALQPFLSACRPLKDLWTPPVTTSLFYILARSGQQALGLNVQDGILASSVIFHVQSCPRNDKSRAASGSGSAGFFGFRQTIPSWRSPAIRQQTGFAGSGPLHWFVLWPLFWL